MADGSNGEFVRRRLTLAEKAAVIAEAFGPGGSVAAVAERRRISSAAIHLWRRQAGGARDAGLAPAAPDASAASAASAFIPVRIAVRNDSPARIEIALGNGRVVKADANVDAARLAAIVEALDGSTP